jgi:hypothetical protein
MRKINKAKKRRAVQQAKRRENRTLSRRGSGGQKSAQSPHLASQGLRSRAPQAVRAFERFDGYAGVRNALRHLAEERGEWAGMPLPLGDGHPLIVEPTYPKAQELMEFGAQPPEQIPEGVAIRNTFWSCHWRAEILVWEEDGKIHWGPVGTGNQLGMLLGTLGAADAWGLEQESNAVKTLGTLIRHRQLKQYLLTGMFMERSPRSHVSYLFRRLRPTIAISTRNGTADAKALCALCLHPIAYYGGSWGGAMTPTDDVIAHLMLMRGDEPLFWRRANQHPISRKEAGVG